ncbi:hypothetical protein Syun_003012 [Stephania yunnanensis]|uniref:Uncharacterized protein n=1 Tax=Stephania yunnanensis TaxID=152371 RepID=A0AAP0L1F6_9MAGN
MGDASARRAREHARSVARVRAHGRMRHQSGPESLLVGVSKEGPEGSSDRPCWRKTVMHREAQGGAAGTTSGGKRLRRRVAQSGGERDGAGWQMQTEQCGVNQCTRDKCPLDWAFCL